LIFGPLFRCGFAGHWDHTDRAISAGIGGGYVLGAPPYADFSRPIRGKSGVPVRTAATRTPPTAGISVDRQLHGAHPNPEAEHPRLLCIARQGKIRVVVCLRRPDVNAGWLCRSLNLFDIEITFRLPACGSEEYSPIRVDVGRAGNTTPDFSPDGSKCVSVRPDGGGIYEIPALAAREVAGAGTD